MFSVILHVSDPYHRTAFMLELNILRLVLDLVSVDSHKFPIAMKTQIFYFNIYVVPLFASIMLINYVHESTYWSEISPKEIELCKSAWFIVTIFAFRLWHFRLNCCDLPSCNSMFTCSLIPRVGQGRVVWYVVSRSPSCFVVELTLSPPESTEFLFLWSLLLSSQSNL